jgi:hypothetical protein
MTATRANGGDEKISTITAPINMDVTRDAHLSAPENFLSRQPMINEIRRGGIIPRRIVDKNESRKAGRIILIPRQQSRAKSIDRKLRFKSIDFLSGFRSRSSWFESVGFWFTAISFNFPSS